MPVRRLPGSPAPAPATFTPPGAPAAPEPAAPELPPVAIRPGEDVIDFFDRVAPAVATMQARLGIAGDGKAARWLLEKSTAVRDRMSTALDVTNEDLASAEGVSRTLRNVTVLALRGELGLTEARRATDLVKESAESMFADEIASLRDAVDRAKRLGAQHTLRAIAAETTSFGAIDAEEVDSGNPLLIEARVAAPADPVPVAAPRPSWGRFAKEASTP